MYDSEDLRNCTSEFHKRSLEVANSPLREALKVEKEEQTLLFCLDIWFMCNFSTYNLL